jgi:hypothetical protein
MTFWLLIFASASIVFCIGWVAGRNSLSLRPTKAEVERWKRGGS